MATSVAAAVHGRDGPIRLDEAFLRDPWSRYPELRERGPVHELDNGDGSRTWLIVGYAEARAALTDPRLAKDAPRVHASIRGEQPPATRPGPDAAIAAHMLNSDPPDHTRLRRLVGKVFTGRRVELLRPRVVELTTGLLDAMEPAGHADLISRFAAPLPIAVICELLGIPDGERTAFRDWTEALISTTPDAPDAVEAAARMAEYLGDLLRRKRAGTADDLLTALAAARDARDALTEDELVSMAFLLLVAGHETTVNLIGNGVLALLRHPDLLARLHTDESLLPAAIEELLRYDGPAHTATLRIAAEPVTIAGTRIAAGELVLVGIGAADRDPDRFHRPERLEIDRDTGHLAFGHGIHFCLGAPLARLEGTVAIGALLRRFPDLRLDAPVESLRWRTSSLLRGLAELPVAW
jgi:cytochrome P450